MKYAAATMLTSCMLLGAFFPVEWAEYVMVPEQYIFGCMYGIPMGLAQHFTHPLFYDRCATNFGRGAFHTQLTVYKIFPCYIGLIIH